MQTALEMAVSLLLWVSKRAAAEAEVTTCTLLVELALYPGQIDSQLGASALLATSRNGLDTWELCGSGLG